MNVLVLIVVVLLALLAVLLLVTGALGATGRLPGNNLLGVRTPETRRSPEAWRIANRAAGPAAMGAGAMLALGALAMALVEGWTGRIVALVGIVMAVLLLNTAGLAGSRAAAMWQSVQDEEHEAGGGCCSGSGETGSDAVAGRAEGSADPAKDCGVAGGCGSCALQGMCEAPAEGSRR